MNSSRRHPTANSPPLYFGCDRLVDSHSIHEALDELLKQQKAESSKGVSHSRGSLVKLVGDPGSLNDDMFADLTDWFLHQDSVALQEINWCKPCKLTDVSLRHIERLFTVFGTKLDVIKINSMCFTEEGISSLLKMVMGVQYDQSGSDGAPKPYFPKELWSGRTRPFVFHLAPLTEQQQMGLFERLWSERRKALQPWNIQEERSRFIAFLDPEENWPRGIALAICMNTRFGGPPTCRNLSKLSWNRKDGTFSENRNLRRRHSSGSSDSDAPHILSNRRKNRRRRSDSYSSSYYTSSRSSTSINSSVSGGRRPRRLETPRCVRPSGLGGRPNSHTSATSGKRKPSSPKVEVGDISLPPPRVWICFSPFCVPMLTPMTFRMPTGGYEMDDCIRLFTEAGGLAHARFCLSGENNVWRDFLDSLTEAMGENPQMLDWFGALCGSGVVEVLDTKVKVRESDFHHCRSALTVLKARAKSEICLIYVCPSFEALFKLKEAKSDLQGVYCITPRTLGRTLLTVQDSKLISRTADEIVTMAIHMEMEVSSGFLKTSRGLRLMIDRLLPMLEDAKAATVNKNKLERQVTAFSSMLEKLETDNS